MTRTEAIRILISHAARNVSGTGCGIRPEISSKDRDLVSQAVSRVYKEAYGYDADTNVFFNLGLDKING